MSDLQKYIARLKLTDLEFSKNQESGYREFKAGVMLKIAREKKRVNAKVIGRRAEKKQQSVLEKYQEQAVSTSCLTG